MKCADRLKYACTGINGESSFEAALLERAPGCEVWGYDFTVKSVRSVTLKVTCLTT
jgi:hypothetical protein